MYKPPELLPFLHSIRLGARRFRELHRLGDSRDVRRRLVRLRVEGALLELKGLLRLAHVALPHDYLNLVLTGQLVMECSDASGTGLLDTRKRSWDPSAVGAARVRYARGAGARAQF